jgi:MoaA/NifB/PqqE/SkfB family radical SAM enzyme
MPEEIPEMPFLRNIGFIVTYRCQVACPHCILEAGPHRTEELALPHAADRIRQIAAYRNRHIRVLSLTGGEPFIDLPRLRLLSDWGAAAGLLVSAVTNAFWASSEAEAIRTLSGLPALRMAAFSCDAYHQAAIPFDNVRHAIRAAQALGLPYNVAVCAQSLDDPELRSLLDRLHALTPPDTINTAITFPAGRALRRLDPARYRLSPDAPVAACAAGSSPIVFPDGRVLACIGPVIDLRDDHPLLLGNLFQEPLAAILDRAEENAVLHAIRVWGPRKLIEAVRTTGPAHRLPNAYIDGSVCNACYALMADAELVAHLRRLATDREFIEKVRYGRAYYMHEASPELLRQAGAAPD